MNSIEDVINKINIKDDSAAKQLLELGVSIRDKEGNLKGLWDIVQEISEIDDEED